MILPVTAKALQDTSSLLAEQLAGRQGALSHYKGSQRPARSQLNPISPVDRIFPFSRASVQWPKHRL